MVGFLATIRSLLVGLLFSVQSPSSIPLYLDETLFYPHPTQATLRIIPATTATFRVRYGSTRTMMTYFSPDSAGTSVTADTPGEFLIENLTQAATYFYQVESSEGGVWRPRGIHSFKTAPASTSAEFVFDVTSDSHFFWSFVADGCKASGLSDSALSTEVYKRVLADRPLFAVDLGDLYFCKCGACGAGCNIDGDGTTGTGSVSETASTETEEQQFCERRIRYSLRYAMLHKADTHLVVVDGNHDGGSQMGDLTGGGGLGQLAHFNGATPGNPKRMLYTVRAARNKYLGNANDPAWYPNVGCDGGCTEQDGDYAYFEIGSAAFVKLNEYIHSPSNWGADSDGDGQSGTVPWDYFPSKASTWDLGSEQEEWFSYQMQNTTAKWVFVMMHHFPGACPDLNTGYHYGRFCLGVERFCSLSPSTPCQCSAAGCYEACAVEDGVCQDPSASSPWIGKAALLISEAKATAARTGGAVFFLLGHDHTAYTWQLEDATGLQPVYFILFPYAGVGAPSWNEQGSPSGFREEVAFLDSDRNATPLFHSHPFWGLPVYVGEKRGTMAGAWSRITVSGQANVKWEVIGAPDFAGTWQPAQFADQTLVCRTYDETGDAPCP